MTESYLKHYSNNTSPFFASCSKILVMDYKSTSSDDDRAWKLTPESPWPRVLKYVLVGSLATGLLIVLAKISQW